MIKPLLIVFTLLSTQTAFGQLNAETMIVCGKKVSYSLLKTAHRTQFKYLIFDNIAIADTKKSKGDRAISIFLDKRAISEENLMALFILLSKKFPSPDSLTIYVETNAKKIPGAGECEREGESEMPDTDTFDDYPYVRFYRLNGNEFFRIFYEKYAPAKTVVIKGKDPFA